jgi:hypothetical protein
VSAIRTVHRNSLAVRTLDLQHVLSNADPTNSRLRLRINCLGVADALEFEARKRVADLQHEDIRNLGRLILSLATGAEVTASADSDVVRRCEAFLAQNYTRELHNLTMTLIRGAPHPPSIADVGRAVAQRAFDEHDDALRAADRSECALAAEYESGRAMRLLLKMGFVNERPEFGPDRRWAQSGDCYVLTLFRDYGKRKTKTFLYCVADPFVRRSLGDVCLILTKRFARVVFHQADGAGVSARAVVLLRRLVTAHGSKQKNRSPSLSASAVPRDGSWPRRHCTEQA